MNYTITRTNSKPTDPVCWVEGSEIYHRADCRQLRKSTNIIHATEEDARRAVMKPCACCKPPRVRGETVYAKDMGRSTARVVCPYCDKYHYHGIIKGDTHNRRVAHCEGVWSTWRDEYNIVWPETDGEGGAR